MTTLYNSLHNSATHKPGYDESCPVCTRKTPRFPLGQCCATPGALAALEENQTYPIVYLKRHESGDWGDLGANDKAMNEAAINPDPEKCDRILSMYKLADGQQIYVITEWDRSVTTVLLRSEY